jgi:hypothetical protein
MMMTTAVHATRAQRDDLNERTPVAPMTPLNVPNLVRRRAGRERTTVARRQQIEDVVVARRAQFDCVPQQQHCRVAVFVPLNRAALY